MLFAPVISNYEYKKKFLLIGINSRILSLFFMGIMLFYSYQFQGHIVMWLIFILITTFSMGGAFANVSYTDILGKSINQSSRKSFLSIKQVVTGTVLLLSVLLARQVLTLEDFPLNYAYMFCIGSIALLIASLGFWQIKERVPSKMFVKNMRHFRS